MTFEIGSTVGDYRIVGAIGNGSGGRLFKGRHEVTGRVEALKVLQPDPSHTRESIARFLREIRLQASLDHPNIARVLNAFHGDGQLVMVMEYVEGHSLRELLLQGPLEIATAIDFACQALNALAYAHGLEVSHRDIKPENILITPEGRLKLTDFGLAKIWSGISLTQTSPPLGSLRYMSPEQVHADNSLDGRTDLYSLGVVLYEMVTGRPPFIDDKPFELMKAHAEQLPRPPSELREIPGELNAAILGALQKKPSDRYASAAEFRRALERVPNTSAAVKKPTLRCTARPLCRHWKAALGAAATLAAVLTFSAVAEWPKALQEAVSPPEIPEYLGRIRPPALAYEKIPAAVESEREQPRPAPTRAAAARPTAQQRTQSPTEPQVPNLEQSEAPGPEQPPLELAFLPEIPDPELVPGLPEKAEEVTVPAAASAAPRLLLIDKWPAGDGADGLVFGADSRSLIAYGKQGFRMWDVHSGESVAESHDSGGELTALALSPNRKTLFLGGSDGSVRTWNVAEGRSTAMLGHPSAVTALSVGDDGKVLVVGLDDRNVHVWSSAGDEGHWERSARKRISKRSPVWVAYSSEPELVTAVSTDRQVQVWPLTGGEIRRIQTFPNGATVAAFSPDGAILAAAGRGEVGIWHVSSGQSITSLETGGTEHSLACLESQRCVGVSANGRTLSVWDLISSELLATVGADADIHRLAVSPDGTEVAALSSDGQLYHWRWNETGCEYLARRLNPEEMSRLIEEVADANEDRRGPFRRLLDTIR